MFLPQRSLTALFLSLHENKIKSENVSIILKDLLYFYFKYDKSVNTYNNFQLNYLKGKNSEKIISTIKEEVRKQFKFFKTSGNFKDYLTSKYIEILEKSDINMTLKKKEDYT